MIGLELGIQELLQDISNPKSACRAVVYKFRVGIPEKTSQVWASEVSEIASCVATADQLRDLLQGSCLPFHTQSHRWANDWLSDPCAQSDMMPRLGIAALKPLRDYMRPFGTAYIRE